MMWSGRLLQSFVHILCISYVSFAHIHILCSYLMLNHILALHQERITHAFTNTDGLNIEEDVEHKVLENTPIIT